MALISQIGLELLETYDSLSSILDVEDDDEERDLSDDRRKDVRMCEKELVIEVKREEGMVSAVGGWSLKEGVVVLPFERVIKAVWERAQKSRHCLLLISFTNLQVDNCSSDRLFPLQILSLSNDSDCAVKSRSKTTSQLVQTKVVVFIRSQISNSNRSKQQAEKSDRTRTNTTRRSIKSKS